MRIRTVFIFTETLGDGKFLRIFGHVCARFVRTNVDRNVTFRIRNPSPLRFEQQSLCCNSVANEKPQTEKVHATTSSFALGLVMFRKI